MSKKVKGDPVWPFCRSKLDVTGCLSDKLVALFKGAGMRMNIEWVWAWWCLEIERAAALMGHEDYLLYVHPYTAIR